MFPRFRAPFVVAAALAAGLAVSCDSVDLSKALQVQPVLTGYYDDGLLNGESHLIPSITFKIKNIDKREHDQLGSARDRQLLVYRGCRRRK